SQGLRLGSGNVHQADLVQANFTVKSSCSNRQLNEAAPRQRGDEVIEAGSARLRRSRRRPLVTAAGIGPVPRRHSMSECDDGKERVHGSTARADGGRSTIARSEPRHAATVPPVCGAVRRVPPTITEGTGG